MKRVTAVLLTLAFLGISSSAWADVPTKMSVQGRLTTAAGAPVPAGFKNFTFKIFDVQVGGVEIWPGGPGETQLLSTDANGLWNAGVGSLIPLTEVVFMVPVRWLEVTVNDGVNPPETLPRIELRTNPYTYRAATSEQADSLAGLGFGELQDLWVNETGDTMSGPLNIVQNNTTGIRTVVVKNLNAGVPSWAPDGAWGITSDVTSNSGTFNLGIGTQTTGNSTTNYALYGVAAGDATSVNYGVYGYAAGGSTNYAGFFQGDMAVTGSSPGDLSVSLPADAISSLETFNEPGLSHTFRFGDVVSTGAVMVVDSVSITTPTAGFVTVTMNGFITIKHVTGTRTIARFALSRTTAEDFDNMSLESIEAGHPSTVIDDGYRCISCVLVDSVGAGAHKYYFVGDRAVGAATSSVTFSRTHLVATYLPTAYGSVAYPLRPIVGRDGAMDAAGSNLGSNSTVMKYDDYLASLKAELDEVQARLKSLEETTPTATTSRKDR